MSTYGKQGELKWVYRHFPLDSLHPKARKEAEALECAGEQGGNTLFWQYTNRLMSVTPSNNQLDPAELNRIGVYVGLSESAFSDCLTSGRFAERVQSDYADAVAHGGRGTPFNVIKVNAPLRGETKSAIIAELTALTGEAPSFTEDDTAFSVSGALPLQNMTTILEILKKN
ncbi:MAG: hypothetical protein G01um101472_360 [Parcubacteria group bacterium Gr01-1014_72]|nr:MAG: hypothetical protein G01um101472_360 [Parcubacteria group bacterium Gr01-1014_72]